MPVYTRVYMTKIYKFDCKGYLMAWYTLTHLIQQQLNS